MKNSVRVSVIAALFGAVSIFCGIILGIISYNSSNAVPYSAANHFVSELGWGKFSKAAWMFNWGLIIGILAFLPVIIALGRHVRTKLGYVAAAFGISAILGGCAVGIFPLDQLKPHIMAALLFFTSWFLAVSLFTLAFCPHRKTWPGATMVAAGTICSLFSLACRVDI